MDPDSPDTKLKTDFGHASEPESATVLLNLVSDGLCAACRRLFHNINVTRQNIDEKPRDFEQVQRPAKAGCAICKIVFASWDHLLKHVSCDDCGTSYRLQQLDVHKYTYIVRVGSGDMAVETREDRDTRQFHVSIMLSPESSDLASHDDEPPSRSTADEKCFELINTWLQTCSTDHGNCIVQPTGWLPTRLVDVADVAMPKVVFTTSIRDRRNTRYVTLSHRWSDNVACLTTANQNEFQSLLPRSKLSNTFLDAFLATSKLGLRYIWIDSLCILQDSVIDWQVESAQMGQVYENGVYNFSAAAASHGEEYDGLFQTRDPIWGRNVCFRLPDQEPETPGTPGTAFRASVTLAEHWYMNVEYSPLNTRGWVLQERFLSPRTVHFASGQIFWECRTEFRSESYPSLPHWTNEEWNDTGLAPRAFKLHSQRPLRTGIGTPQALWWRLVTAYAGPGLTQETDRLMALAGIARAFSLSGMKSSESAVPPGPRSWSYLAGLWQEELPWNLCWRVRNLAHSSCTRADKYRAPSWSWASLDFQRVELQTSHESGMEAHQPAVVEVLGTKIFPREGFDDFGPLLGGVVFLRGHVHDVDLSRLAPLIAPSLSSFRITGEGNLPFELQLDDSRHTDSLRDVADCCLPVFVSRRSAGFRVKRYAECLLLKRHTPAWMSQATILSAYARVGILRISLEESKPGGPVEYTMKMDMPDMLSVVVTMCRPVGNWEDGKQVAETGRIIALH